MQYFSIKFFFYQFSRLNRNVYIHFNQINSIRFIPNPKPLVIESLMIIVLDCPRANCKIKCHWKLKFCFVFKINSRTVVYLNLYVCCKTNKSKFNQTESVKKLQADDSCVRMSVIFYMSFLRPSCSYFFGFQVVLAESVFVCVYRCKINHSFHFGTRKI